MGLIGRSGGTGRDLWSDMYSKGRFDTHMSKVYFLFLCEEATNSCVSERLYAKLPPSALSFSYAR